MTRLTLVAPLGVPMKDEAGLLLFVDAGKLTPQFGTFSP